MPTGDHAEAGGNCGFGCKAGPDVTHGREEDRNNPAYAQSGQDVCRYGYHARRDPMCDSRTSVMGVVYDKVSQARARRYDAAAWLVAQ